MSVEVDASYYNVEKLNGAVCGFIDGDSDCFHAHLKCNLVDKMCCVHMCRVTFDKSNGTTVASLSTLCYLDR